MKAMTLTIFLFASTSVFAKSSTLKEYQDVSKKLDEVHSQLDQIQQNPVAQASCIVSENEIIQPDSMKSEWLRLKSDYNCLDGRKRIEDMEIDIPDHLIRKTGLISKDAYFGVNYGSRDLLAIVPKKSADGKETIFKAVVSYCSYSGPIPGQDFIGGKAKLTDLKVASPAVLSQSTSCQNGLIDDAWITVTSDTFGAIPTRFSSIRNCH